MSHYLLLLLVVEICPTNALHAFFLFLEKGGPQWQSYKFDMSVRMFLLQAPPFSVAPPYHSIKKYI